MVLRGRGFVPNNVVPCIQILSATVTLQSGVTETNTKNKLADKILNINRFGLRMVLCWTTAGKCYTSKALPERQVECRYFEGRYLSDPVLYIILLSDWPFRVAGKTNRSPKPKLYRLKGKILGK